MKLTGILLLIFSLSLSARTASQTITLSVRHASIDKVFEAIQQQTGYSVICNYDLIQKAKPVSIESVRVPLADFLDRLLQDQELEYVIRSKTIVVRAKDHPPASPEKKKPFFPAAQPDPVTGTLLRAGTKEPLAGATILIKGTKRSVISDEQGKFSIDAKVGEVLVITYVGFESKEVKIAATRIGNIFLKASAAKLEEVEVQFSTGYYQVPRERATGSFALIDNKTLNRTAGPDIISRMEGVTNGLLFNRTGASGENNDAYQLELRGRATLLSESGPLIVLNNFPYEGRITDINPQDIESISILKDAAAASIWGARAGNGVIVITTKEGKYNRKPVVSFRHTSTFTQKPDLFYDKHYLPAEEVMAIEREKMDNGHYGAFADRDLAYTPYADYMIQLDRGLISQAAFDSIEAAFMTRDVRHEALKYFYQVGHRSQSSLSVSGGSETNRYYFSAGYDKNKGTLVRNHDERIFLNFQNNYRPVQKVDIGIRVQYTNAKAYNNGLNITELSSVRSGLLPYMKLVNDDGTPASVEHTIREHVIDEELVPDQLDWHYRPVEELLLNDRISKSSQLSVNATANYQFLKGFTLEAAYGFIKSNAIDQTYYAPESYYVRNLVNRFTQHDGTRIIPHAGIYTTGSPVETIQHAGRMLLRVNKQIGDGELAAIGGGEIREVNTTYGPEVYLYNYNKELGTGGDTRMDYTRSFPNYPASMGSQFVPRANPIVNSGVLNRFLSYFGNVSYAYKGRYIISGSMRWDGSNIFGVRTNQKGIPLWSGGLSWDISRERFFQSEVVGHLNLRATYGSSGNTNPTVSTFPVFQERVLRGLTASRPYAYLQSFGDRSLRWEQVNTWNLGLDFALLNNRISGSLEYYIKSAKDLIGAGHLPPSSGVNSRNTQRSFRYNYAAMRTHGVDFQLLTQNIKGEFEWSTNWLFNYTKNKVTEYYNAPSTLGSSVFGASYLAIGKPFETIYAYPYNGLDPETGAMLLYDREGNKTTNYNELNQIYTPAEMLDMGVTSPPLYGSALNTFGYKGIQLNILVTWKAGYVYRRTSMFNGEQYGTTSSNIIKFHNDINRRWQKPGDEKRTFVPAGGSVSGYNSMEAYYYHNSSVLISKGDYINLQYINLSYDVPVFIAQKAGMKQLSIYVTAERLGFLWKAEAFNVDPQTPNARYPMAKSFTIGVLANF